MSRPDTKGKRSAQVLDRNAGPLSAALSRHLTERRRQTPSTDGDESSGLSNNESNQGQESSIDGFSDDDEYGTPIRSRQRFTTEETRILEEVYQTASRPSSETKQNLAIQFDTTPQRIQIWFQNRRAKQKKISSGDGGPMPDVESMPGGEDPSSSRSRGRSSTMDGSEPTVNEQRKRVSRSKKTIIESEKKKRRVDHDNADNRLPIQLNLPAQNYSTNRSHRILGIDSESPTAFYQSGPADNNTQFNPALQCHPVFISRPNHADLEPYYPDYDTSKLYYTVAPSPTINPQDVASPFPTYVVPFDPNDPYLPPVVSNQPQTSMGGSKLMYKPNITDDNSSLLDVLAEASTYRRQQAVPIVLDSQLHHATTAEEEVESTSLTDEVDLQKKGDLLFDALT